MTAPIDRLNRVLLVLLGLILLAAGVVGLLISTRVFGDSVADQTVLRPDTRAFADRNADWFWIVVAVVAAVLTLLALRWLLAQTRGQRVSTLSLEPDRSSGATRLSSGALTDAVSDEAESIHGIGSASAGLLGKQSDPLLRLDLKLGPDSDLGYVRRRLEQDVVPHARQAAAMPHLPVWVRFTVPAEQRRSVQ